MHITINDKYILNRIIFILSYNTSKTMFKSKTYMSYLLELVFYKICHYFFQVLERQTIMNNQGYRPEQFLKDK